jgi:hypothetical protein
VVDPSTAVGYYPLYWGPLDEMGDAVNDDGLDAFDIMVEMKMFEMLLATEPDPFIVKLLVNVAKRYGVSSTNIEELVGASMLTDMSQEDYWGLYDRAFDSICIDKGGVLIDTGIAGRMKQCSHRSESKCHAKSPWIEGQGPNAPDTENITYTEWRDRDFFNQNYSPARVPRGAAGACIVQSPVPHEMCSSELICRKSRTGTQCYKNKYIRNRGICQNTRELCSGFGVSYCPNMRKPGGSGGDCPTALDGSQADLGPYANILRPGETLPSCYKSVNDNWAEFFLGSTIYRYFKSGAPGEDLGDFLLGQTGVKQVDIIGRGISGDGRGLSSLAGAQYASQQATEALTALIIGDCRRSNGYLAQGGGCAPCPTGSVSKDVYPGDGTVMLQCAPCPIEGQVGSLGSCICPGGSAPVNNKCPPPPDNPPGPWDGPATPTPPGVTRAVRPTATFVTSTHQPSLIRCPNAGERGIMLGDGLHCYSCPTGTTATDLSPSGACLSCPSGKTLSSDNAWCYTCPAGSSWRGSALGCVSGTASIITNPATSTPPVPTGQTVPSSYQGYQCSAGTFTTDFGSSNPVQCYSCPSGTRINYGRTGCISCPQGYDISTINSTCTGCPSGYTMNSDKSACTRT